MDFYTRLRLAAGVIFNGKSALQVLSTWQEGSPAYSLGSFEQNVRKGYRFNELIYACIMTKADAAGAATLRAYDRKSDLELETHPARQLLEEPNEHMTEFDFYALSLMCLDLAGRAYWEKRRNRRGDIIELWPLRPDWVAAIKSGDKFIDHFVYNVPGETPQPIAVEDVLDFKVYDPLDLYASAPPVSVAARAVDTDNAATDFLNKTFKNGGMPTGLLSSKQRLADDQVDDIRRRWVERYGGWLNWLKGPAVLDSDATYQRTGMTFQEMGLEFLDARAEARICEVMRVPPILVGAKVGLDRSTFANAAEAQEFFWRNMLMPQLKRIRDELEVDLMRREYADGATLRWDYSDVIALREDRNKAFDRAFRGVQTGFMTVNMGLEEIGEEGIGPEGDVFLRPLTVQVVPLKRAGGIIPLTDPENTPDEGNTGDKPALEPPAEDQQPASNNPAVDAQGNPIKSRKQAPAPEDCIDCDEKKKRKHRGKRAGRTAEPKEIKLGNPDDDCDLIENELEAAMVSFFTESRDRIQAVISEQAAGGALDNLFS